ncbi:MAG: hypothetical protein SGARI_007730, partial [Bacillariaceae sp.]
MSDGTNAAPIQDLEGLICLIMDYEGKLAKGELAELNLDLFEGNETLSDSCKILDLQWSKERCAATLKTLAER